MAVHDIIVSGAGPAGSACASMLAGKGIDVLLLDREKFPRNKPCGGGVVRKAMDLLVEMFGDTAEQELNQLGIVENPAGKISFHYHPLGKEFVVERDKAMISMVDRVNFDQWLLQKAQKQGIRFIDDCNVLNIEKKDRIVIMTGKGEFECRFLVAAMGWNGLGSNWIKQYKTIMPAYECKVLPGQDLLKSLKGTARFDVGFLPDGYFWAFPKRDHISVGVMSTQKTKVKLKDYFDRYLGLLGMSDAEISDQHGSMIPAYPRDNLFEIPELLYAGDAAGLADPIVAEGITHALQSGFLAARALLEGNLEGDRVQKIYREKLNEHILPQLRIARRLAWVLYHKPGLSKLAFKKIGNQLTQAVASVFEGKRTYPAGINEYSRALIKILFHQPPTTNHQPPITNHQSPTTTPQHRSSQNQHPPAP